MSNNHITLEKSEHEFMRTQFCRRVALIFCQIHNVSLVGLQAYMLHGILSLNTFILSLKRNTTNQIRLLTRKQRFQRSVSRLERVFKKDNTSVLEEARRLRWNVLEVNGWSRNVAGSFFFRLLFLIKQVLSTFQTYYVTLFEEQRELFSFIL